METNLREAKTSVKVTGYLSEKDLKEEVVDGASVISGYVTVKVDDINSVRFNVRQSSLKKDGTKNKLFEGIQTVMNEYSSIAEVGAENATKVVVTNGQLNLYHDKQTGASRVGFKSSFFNRYKGNEMDFVPMTEFGVETFISSMTPEIDTNGEETGRLVVTGWVPTYSGIEQIKLIAPEDVAGDLESGFNLGETVAFYGNIVNGRAQKVEIPMRIGKPRIEYKPGKQELIIEGVSDVYELDAVNPEARGYEAEVIKAAIQERANKLEEEKANANNNAPRQNTTPSAIAKGRTLGF